ncbi:MAG: ABC transporter permease [Bdellovibrionaceae bacterium]|nr:ABC transporter permease [Pseudobdellovibrionaceae bacterium]NUM59263.1 ABC transporter permease [Pseudobdellovibrionaceae bacterium]
MNYIVSFKTFSRAIFLLLLMLIFSCSLWINDKPLVIKYNQNWYYPIFFNYYPEDFQLIEEINLDYKTLDPRKIQFLINPIVNWNPYQSDMSLAEIPASPSSSHLWGTDDRGRDLFARCIYASKTLLFITFLGVGMSTFLGVILGSLAGFLGGVFDFIMLRFIEVVQSIPFLFLAGSLFSFSSGSYLKTILIISFFYSFKSILPTRAFVMDFKHREFINASRLLGMNSIQIWYFHILRHCREIFQMQIPTMLLQFCLVLTSLEYLGFGVQPPEPSFGEIFMQAQNQFLTAPWILWFPCIYFFTLLLSISSVLKQIPKIVSNQIT